MKTGVYYHINGSVGDYRISVASAMGYLFREEIRIDQSAPPQGSDEEMPSVRYSTKARTGRRSPMESSTVLGPPLSAVVYI